eukprot:5171490-Amphidinium_carterae.1
MQENLRTPEVELSDEDRLLADLTPMDEDEIPLADLIMHNHVASPKPKAKGKAQPKGKAKAFPKRAAAPHGLVH